MDPTSTPLFHSRDLPLPKRWPKRVMAAVLHALGLAHFVATLARADAANSMLPVVRALGEADQAKGAQGVGRQAEAIKDAFMRRMMKATRMRYAPTERLAILELKAATGWSNSQTARRFLVARSTIRRWSKRLEADGPEGLVRMDKPVNRFPDFVRYIVHRLKAFHPQLGKVKIAETLCRAGVNISAATVGRVRNEQTPSKPPQEQRPSEPSQGQAKLESQKSQTASESSQGKPSPDATACDETASETCAKTPEAARGLDVQADHDHADERKPREIISRHPNHTWHIDFTLVPTWIGGLCAKWAPNALLQRWPFCWWVAIVTDHFSRRVLGESVFAKQPSAEETVTFLDRVTAEVGRSPRYAITDKGVQFWDNHGSQPAKAYAGWCKRHDVRARFGKVGSRRSIAVIERFMRTLKDECTRRLIVDMSRDQFAQELSLFTTWFNRHRPHSFLKGATPDEKYSGRTPVHQLLRYETRPSYPLAARAASSQAPPIARRAANLEVEIVYMEGRRHLPIVELRRTA